MKQEELNKILENHQHWLNSDCEGWQEMRANLSYADLSDTNLRHSNLRYANLHYANLSGADLSSADLSGAELRYADLYIADLRDINLSSANLSYADLSGANLRCANLRCANLYGANLRCTDLSGDNLMGAELSNADLRDADLRYAKNVPYIPMVCPEEGSFIGFKKIEDYIVELEIPSNSRRSSATTRKCRCEFAKVLSIIDRNGKEIQSITNHNYSETIYEVGKMVYPDSFDENRWNECSHGIHFFINKQEAINY